MIKGKKQILLLSILGVTTLLVAIIGATYAYFTTSMTGRNGTINTTTAKIGAASFTAASVSVDKVLPGWTSGEKNVTVTLEPSDYDVNYTCTLKMTANPLTDLTLTVAGTNALTSVNGKLKSGASDTIIASGTLKANQTKQSVSMTYTLSFPETGVDQNTQQGKTITGLVTCSTEGQTVYYNSENPNGTTTKPTGTNSISLQEAILRDNPTISERTDFSVTNTSNTTGTIYQTNKTEDGSTVYYYSGNTTKNWIKFGGFYWRIIRTNEDESVRMLYSGTSHDTTTGYIGKTVYNNTYNNPMYVGYMYGTSGTLENNRTNTNNSTIKKYIDTWYKNNLLTNYDKYISKSAIYCNDRSTENNSYSTSTMFDYGVRTRLNNNNPIYKCGGDGNEGLFESIQAVADKFSASTTGGGNGQLTYPIALMTADEITFAGGKTWTSMSSPYAWFYTNSQGSSITGNNNYSGWWSLSPQYSYGNNSISMYYVGVDDFPSNLYVANLNANIVVRPAVSLASCVKIKSGNGTPESPYEIDYEGSCN